MKVTVKTINPKIVTDVVSTNMKYTWSLILLNGVMFINWYSIFYKNVAKVKVKNTKCHFIKPY